MPVRVVQPDTASGGTTEAALPVPGDCSLIRGITVGDVVIVLPVNAVLPVEAEPINETLLNTLAAHGLLNVGRPRYRRTSGWRA
jgi:hypothetical protein